MLTRTLLLAGVALGGPIGGPIGGSPPAGGEAFARDVVEGATLRRSFQIVSELGLEALEVEIDGAPQPPPRGLEIELEKRRTWVVEDDFGAPAGGRPRTLVRYFEKLSGSDVRRVAGPDGDSDSGREVSSPLEGRAVRFALGPNDEGEHAVAFEGGGGDEALLAELAEDMDLRRWLPPPGREVEVGASWELPAEAWLALAAPGGLELASTADTDLDRRMARELREGIAGELRASYRGREERGGVELAVVALEVELESRAGGPLPTDDEARLELEVEVAHRLAGELLWHSGGGHLAALSLEGETELVERLRFEQAGSERVQVSRLRGETRWVIDVAHP